MTGMEKPKRDLSAELMDGAEAMRKHRAGKLTLPAQTASTGKTLQLKAALVLSGALAYNLQKRPAKLDTEDCHA